MIFMILSLVLNICVTPHNFITELDSSCIRSNGIGNKMFLYVVDRVPVLLLLVSLLMNISFINTCDIFKHANNFVTPHNFHTGYTYI